MNNNITAKEQAQKNIEELAEALANCGIEACLTDPTEDCTSILCIETQSFKNGSGVQVEIWAEEYSDYEIEFGVNPYEEIMAELETDIAEAKAKIAER